ncbi:MAG: chemotaxis protein CheA [Balneolaceae bacterium]
MAFRNFTSRVGAGTEPDVNREGYRIPDDFDVELAGDYVDECTDLIREAEAAVLKLESNPGDQELINTIFRMFHTIKGTSEFMELVPVAGFTHKAESLLDLIRDGKLAFSEISADLTLEAIDIIRYYLRIVETASGGEEIPVPPGKKALEEIIDRVIEDGRPLAEAVRESSHTSGPSPHYSFGRWNSSQATREKQETGMPFDDTGEAESEKTAEEESTVRVTLQRLDRLVDLVGELVISHSSLVQDPEVTSNPMLVDKLARAGSTLRELQDVALESRMVPLRATFQKMSRIVRDLARKSDKSVQFVTHGDEAEIDRNLVDLLADPLVHIIRNSIDHGIENPGERESAGKSSKAEIRLQAFQEGGKVMIEVSDDGRGIDTSKVFEKAVEKGFVQQGTDLQDEEILRLIFHPGITSTEKVTELSGRGVGLDVVRQSAERMQGKIDIYSERGIGTRISLEIPCTLAVTNGLMIQSGSEKFIIPALQIERVCRMEESRLLPRQEETEMVQISENRMPLVRLHQLFHIERETDAAEAGILVVVRSKSGNYAVQVDRVIGQQQVVGKPIRTPFALKYIAGGAILGDGRVGLILDTHSLINRVTDKKFESITQPPVSEPGEPAIV